VKAARENATSASRSTGAKLNSPLRACRISAHQGREADTATGVRVEAGEVGLLERLERGQCFSKASSRAACRRAPRPARGPQASRTDVPRAPGDRAHRRPTVAEGGGWMV
jgi:hypothetical protein